MHRKRLSSPKHVFRRHFRGFTCSWDSKEILRNKGSHWSCSSGSPGCGFQDGALTSRTNFPCLGLLSCLSPEPQELCPCIDHPLPSNVLFQDGTIDCSSAEKMKLQYQVSVGCDCAKAAVSNFSQLAFHWKTLLVPTARPYFYLN